MARRTANSDTNDGEKRPVGAKDRVRSAVGRAASLRTEPQLAPGRWGLEVGTDGRLRRGDIALVDIAAEHGSPVHVVDLDRLDEHVDRLRRSAGTGSIAVTHELVAVGPLLARMHDRGLLGVVASIDELERAIAIGIDPASIVFGEAAPTTASIERAVDAGVRAITISAVDQVAIAGSVAARRPAGATPIPIALDVVAGDGGPIGSIADADTARSVADDIAALAGIALRMIRVRRPDPVDGADTTADAAAAITSIARVVERHPVEEIMLTADVEPATTPPIRGARGRLNRFAGLDLATPRPSLGADPATLAALAGAAVRDIAGDGCRLILEPGRALTASSQLLLATVLDVKDDGEPVHVVLDAGINLAEQTQAHYHQLFNASCAAGPRSGPFRMVGPICTPADVLYTNWRLPRAEPGDVLAIMDTGAGFVALSTSFSFPRPAVVGISGDDVGVLRRSETFDDLIALDLVGPATEPTRSDDRS